MQNKERILRAAKEKSQITYKGRTIRTTPDSCFPKHESQKVLGRCAADTKRPQMQAKTNIPSKASINIDGENKIFYDKTRFKQYVPTNPAF